MEAQGILNQDNDSHLAALQYCFIPRINRRLENFKKAHNMRPCRSLKNKTPQQQYILGRMKYKPNVPEDITEKINDELVNLAPLKDVLNDAQITTLKARLALTKCTTWPIWNRTFRDCPRRNQYLL